MHNHLYYIARPNLEAGRVPAFDEPLLAPQMMFLVASSVSGGRRHDDADHRKRRTVCRSEPAGTRSRQARLRVRISTSLAPYLKERVPISFKMHQLSSAAEARQFVDYWAKRGCYLIQGLHEYYACRVEGCHRCCARHGLKITGHLCSVTYAEAAELGIDDLEHGFGVNTQLDPGKKPDECTESDGEETLKAMDPDGPEASKLIGLLVSHHVRGHFNAAGVRNHEGGAAAASDTDARCHERAGAGGLSVCPQTVRFRKPDRRR